MSPWIIDNKSRFLKYMIEKKRADLGSERVRKQINYKR